MSKGWLFILLVAAVIALAAVAILGLSTMVVASVAAVALAIAAWLYFSVIKQLMAVQNGLYLLKAQDFSSRLAKVGDRDADTIVSLFNRLMDTLKEERLKKEEQDQFLQQLIEASPMGIAICSLDGEPRTVNPAYRQLLNPHLDAEIKRLALGQVRTVRTEGSQIYRISRLWFMERGFQRPFILIEKITDEIVKVEKQTYGKVIRTMAHEVNNTLGAMTSVFETLLETEGDPDVAATLDSCRMRCLSLSEFIKNYAAIVKVPPPSLRPVSLRAEVEKAMPLLTKMADGTATITLNGTDALVDADPALMQQVIINIIKNAVEAIASAPDADAPANDGIHPDNDGKIEIKFEGKTIKFINNGPDIPPEAAENLFTPFFTTKPRGHGLGLMLVAEILRSHRAPFTLTSHSHLTTFTITFP